MDVYMFCAPGIKGQSKGCFDRPALLRIINSYNRKYKDQIIYKSSNTDDELWSLIKDHLAEFFETRGQPGFEREEWAWMDVPLLKGDPELNKYYKPPKPKDRTQWLSTPDLKDTLKQYERVYDDFVFMGAVPIDFDGIFEEFKHLDLCSLYHGRGLSLSSGTVHARRKVRRFGFVFNLDPHDKPGSHWVAMFLDLTVPQPYVGFWDSYGKCPPPHQISTLMTRLKEQCLQCLGIDLVLKCNTIRHQFKNYDCGSFCLYFIYNSLKGKTFEAITEDLILDDDVANQYRDFMMRPSLE